MDAYAHALGALREDNFRRLRAYVPEPNSKFSSWLVVVVRRLVRDHLRHRYGRSRSKRRENQDEQQTRRRLEGLLVERIDPDELETSAEGGPDADLRRHELLEAVRRAVDELAPTDRLLLALRFEDDRPVKEIARLLQLPTVFHVYRRLGHALDRVREVLVRRGVEDGEP